MRRVSADRYDKAYLLSDDTEGYEEFRRGSLSHVKRLQLDMLELEPGTTLLEVGFGRGEMLYHFACRGADVAGIDYSKDALEIARSTLEAFPDADLRVADCKNLPFESDSFDRVYSGDVLEHQNIEDGAMMLREMYRVLHPGGFMLVHTSPNTVFTKLFYPLARPLLRVIDGDAVRVLEEHMEVNREVHVHEYNPVSLRRVARMAGLDAAEIWVGADILRSGQHRHTRSLAENPVVKAIARMGRFRAVRFAFGNDLYLKHGKPAPSAAG